MFVQRVEIVRIEARLSAEHDGALLAARTVSHFMFVVVHGGPKSALAGAHLGELLDEVERIEDAVVGGFAPEHGHGVGCVANECHASVAIVPFEAGPVLDGDLEDGCGFGNAVHGVAEKRVEVLGVALHLGDALGTVLLVCFAAAATATATALVTSLEHPGGDDLDNIAFLLCALGSVDLGTFHHGDPEEIAGGGVASLEEERINISQWPDLFWRHVYRRADETHGKLMRAMLVWHEEFSRRRVGPLRADQHAPIRRGAVGEGDTNETSSAAV